MEELIQENDRLFGTVRKKISAHLWLQQVLSGNDFKKDWRWSLHVIVDELTTADELRKAWPEIDSARQDLKSAQGSDPKIFSISLMYDLVEQKKKVSYGILAKDLNFDALTYLLWLFDEKKGETERTAGLINFVNLFHAMGFKNKNLEDLKKDGEEMIARGKAPWGLSTGPISLNKVSRAIDKYNQNIKNQTIVIPPLYNNNQIELARLFAFGRGYWQKAKELLQKSFPDEFRKYDERYDLRKLEIHQKTIRKSGLNSE